MTAAGLAARPRSPARRPGRCLHCRRTRSLRRGLCWTCHVRPAIRALYPPVPCKFTRRGVGLIGGPRSLPPAPTDAPPGTPRKLEVLAERARLGCELWHPDDA